MLFLNYKIQIKGLKVIFTFYKFYVTIDQIFTLRKLTEKHEEFEKYLYACYIDFMKAFDRIWEKVRFYKYPE